MEGFLFHQVELDINTQILGTKTERKKRKKVITLPKRQLRHPTATHGKIIGARCENGRRENRQTYRGCEHARFVRVPRHVTHNIVLEGEKRS